MEQLESRLVPYGLSGSAWTHPERVTISFVPDGTVMTYQGDTPIVSNLFATFNARWGSPSVWQPVILHAAQSWARQTNINFSVVADNGAELGSGDYIQGDPGMGDIRIGGYDFGSSTLASAYYPPWASNYSITGDIRFNTAQPFNIGSAYDLFTVAAHEFGHALGLDHSETFGGVMWSSYIGTQTALTADDIAGIRAIYGGARRADAYDLAASNNTLATASDLTARIDATQRALVTGLDLTTSSDSDYYKFTVPSGTSGTLQVTVQSAGLSLLAPRLTLYSGTGTQLATTNASSASSGSYQQYGATLTLTRTGVTAGQTYTIRVDSTNSFAAFRTGAYAVTLNFGAQPSYAVPLPNTQVLANPDHSGGGGGALDGFDVYGTDHDHDEEAPPLPVAGVDAPPSGKTAPAPAAPGHDLADLLLDSPRPSAPVPNQTRAAEPSRAVAPRDQFFAALAKEHQHFASAEMKADASDATDDGWMAVRSDAFTLGKELAL